MLIYKLNRPQDMKRDIVIWAINVHNELLKAVAGNIERYQTLQTEDNKCS